MAKQRTYQDIKEAVQKYQDRLSRLYVWLLPEEKEYVRSKAEGDGVSVSEYVRRKIIPDSIREDMEESSKTKAEGKE